VRRGRLRSALDRRELTGVARSYPVRKAVTPAQKREAVALAAIVGIEAAAEQLGWDRRTVRKWSEAAGHPPELDGTATGWRELLDLAQSQVATALASGKVRPKDVAVIAAIAERNLRQLADRSDERETEPQETWADRFDRWCDETYPSRHPAEIAKDVPSHVIGYVLHLRTHEQSFGQEEDRSDHGRTDPGDDFWFGWACATVEAVGDLVAFEAEYRRWYAEVQTYEATLRQHAETMMWSTAEGTGHTAPPPVRYPEALEIAHVMSQDLLPVAPAWADATGGLVDEPSTPGDC
jgi:hypothetical protein